ncbi:hypothetical protein OW763_12435 [Clostridium aestuarii]|uniref:Small, acid-soluble spore protein, alpha/beta type n=1 Tax=Clostridium aestuarii TaxID=338193 RepID=A0ABT4D1M0_9CLOT|nr:hypothetical protein [Clostridium aestuarii]MCY6485146.1 hypothetical protein [Clostridium aestuarii]
MSQKNIEMMKKLIEEKKKNSANQKNGLRPTKVIGNQRKGIKSHNGGGLFDK